MERKHALTGHLTALVTVFIWGTTFISTKILLRALEPVEILFLRFSLGYLALWLACPKKLRLSDRKQELYFAAAGLCGVTLYFLLENIALTYTFASNVGVVVSISPFLIALLAHFFLDGEKLRAQFFIGFSVALAGIFLISFNGNTVLKLNPVGDVLAMLAAVTWAFYSVLTRKISRFGYSTIQTTRRAFFYGLIFMLPALPILGFSPEAAKLAEPVNLFNLLFLGLGASAMCFVTWGAAVKMLGAVKTGVYIYAVPVITVVSSALILREKITGLAVLGTVLTLAGLIISESKRLLPKKEALAHE